MSAGEMALHGPATEACRCCGTPAAPLWHGRLLDLEVAYFECPHCGFVQTERPHWLERAYASAINDSDTGIVARNQVNARIVVTTLGLLSALEHRVVDYAGGYGLLVRMLRDYGVDALWSDAFCANLLARGFEHQTEDAALVTAFEAFEHFVDPPAELARMLDVAPNVLLSTRLIPVPPPPHDQWWYYGREHGQHVALYRARTLRLLAERHGKHFVTDGAAYHLISDRPVSPRRWKLLVRGTRIFAPLFARRLQSRTWTDHERAAGRASTD